VAYSCRQRVDSLFSLYIHINTSVRSNSNYTPVLRVFSFKCEIILRIISKRAITPLNAAKMKSNSNASPFGYFCFKIPLMSGAM
ncbi:hypothetical protein ABHC52_10745, partial [Ruminococcus bicirculans (ex Wegman et al. 2014)]|uniref:hypothetical protein n=1 Tax=Ruminococcus bicirculans (ex Wegman et al. 2014) TaxID=1160721 RepID=UPI00325BAC01